MHALVGDTTSANQELKNIRQNEIPKMFYGHQIYLESRILLAMGKRDAAINVMKRALDEGAFFGLDQQWQQDIFVKSLFDHPEFQEMVQPKG